MNRFNLLLNLAFLLVTSGVFLLSFSILSGSIELIVRLWQRIFRSWTMSKLQVLGMVRKEEKEFHFQIDWRRGMILLAIPVLAVAVHDFLLSPLVVLFGGLLFFWIRYQAGQADRNLPVGNRSRRHGGVGHRGEHHAQGVA